MHAADLAYHLRIVQGLAERVMDQTPIWESPTEARYTKVLQEKIETIQQTLEELKKNPQSDKNIGEQLKIIYRDDEKEKLLFEQWKQIAGQSRLINKKELTELENNMKRMKTELEKAAPHVKELITDPEEVHAIIPELYRNPEQTQQ